MSLIERQVKDAVEDAVRPLQRQQRELSDRMDSLSRARSGAGVSGEGVMFGGAPNIRRGENSMSSRGYSMLRALGFAAGIVEAENAKVEIDFHNRLKERFPALQSQQRDSILMPLGSRLLRFADPSFAEECRQTAAAGIAGCDPDEIRQFAPRGVTQALSWLSDSAGGSLVPTASGAPDGELIELLRAKEVFSRAGSTELILDESGKFRLPRQTAATTAYWVGESTAITESEPETDAVSLQAKKLGILTRVPNELFRRTVNPSFEALLRSDMAQVLARAADQAMINAQASATRVGGVLTYGVTSIRATTQDNGGDTLEPEDFGRLLAELEDANVDIDGDDSVAFVTRPRVAWDVINRRGDAVSAGDGKGPFVFSMNRSQIENGQPARVLGYRLMTSTAVPDDREVIGQTSSSASNSTLLLCGRFRDWVIARQPAIELMLSPHAGTAFAQDESMLRALMFLDAAPRHVESFAMCDGLLEPS